MHTKVDSNYESFNTNFAAITLLLDFVWNKPVGFLIKIYAAVS